MMFKTMLTVAAVSVVVSAAALASDDDARNAQTGPALAVSDILAKVKAMGYTKIREIEREDGAFEVKAIDANGASVKLYLNAATGKPMTGRDDD